MCGKSKRAFVLGTLAATAAEVGQFTEAIRYQKEALEVPDGYSEKDKEKARKRLQQYEAGKPHREVD